MRRLTRWILGLAAVAALVLAGCGLFGDGGYTISAQFDRTVNLFPGSPVRVLGIDVGQIGDVTVSEDQTFVTAEIRLDEGVQIPAEASALVIPEMLLGERYIQFEPPYEGGPALQDGDTIPRERTIVPFEFDEVLESLNSFVTGIDENELARLMANMADVLEGQGEKLNATIRNAQQAVGILRENDSELVSLAGRLADLNETLATRTDEIGQIIEDWNTVSATLADNSGNIEAALNGLVRLTTDVSDLMQTNRTILEADVATLTRLLRTTRRNIDNVSNAILSSAELFRHADRVIDRQHNWLPLSNHADKQILAGLIAENLSRRLAGVCERSSLTPEQCSQVPMPSGDGVCLPPVSPCDPGQQTFAEALREAITRFEELLAEGGAPPPPAPPGGGGTPAPPVGGGGGGSGGGGGTGGGGGAGGGDGGSGGGGGIDVLPGVRP